MASISNSHRPHRKTSSGCWTCRARKVKCDEGKPTCRQCRRYGRECEGYEVRLRWVDDDVDLAEQPGSRRSQVARSPPRDPLPYYRVEEILSTLDGLEPAEQTDVSLFLSGFGVFGNVHSFQAASFSVPAPVLVPTAYTPRRKDFAQPDADVYSPIGAAEYLPGTVESNLGGVLTEHPQHEDGASTTSSGLCAEPIHLTPSERFLLNHYANRVVNIFCVVENERNPWKAIHLPKALQTVGELSLTGSTSRIRQALLSTLLSVSAFCLFNYRKSQLRRDEALHWKATAEELRCKAIELLKGAVENDLYMCPRPKYKEFLATMLSMVTINVMSGDIETCGVHLDGALRFIHHAYSWKTRYSSKAQALHRQYLYLRTIYESTSPRGQVSSDLDVFCHELFRNLSHSSDDTSYETVYGVPYALLALLTQAIELINKLHAASSPSACPNSQYLVPPHLATECDTLESKTMDWTWSDSASQTPADLNTDIASRIITHQTTAFHNALIIYLAQHIRLLSHRFLQPYVKAVLDSMEAIEEIKRETNILAAPLYWPAFIAASETFDSSLQGRFRKWHERMEVYGVEALRTGMDVVGEVWVRGPPTGAGRRTCLWREVVEHGGWALMLS
ncbi:fungal-specific transcription factor domain-containing protein [Aspergillus multicolor]|uniref:Zn(II)2Cys6 transcription factor n=1 Tax=Aspergillus multicolor TaxID=41759 RepID=UPI003CCD8B56